MIELPSWLPIHQFLVKNQQIIKKLFFIFYLVGIFLIGVGFYLFSVNIEIYVLLATFANEVGTISLLLFLTTLIPGICKRLKILPLLSASIVLFRRHIGIFMYILALLHSSYLSFIPYFLTEGFNLESLTSHEIYGFLAVLILFPVWITSNDLSQKKFGKWWKRIQRLTFIAIVFIFLHVASVSRTSALITAAVFLLEFISWIKVWFIEPKIIEAQEPKTPDDTRG